MTACDLFLIPLTEQIKRPAEKLASLVLQAAELQDLSLLQGQRRYQYLVSRFYLKIILSGVFGISEPIAMRLVRRKDLPPVLEPPWDIDIAISHSGDVVLLAVSKCGPVAVDVERHRRRKFVEFAEAYFHPSIAGELKSLPLSDLEQRFYGYWARLESGLKLANGSVLSDLISRFYPRVLLEGGEGGHFSSYAASYEDYSVAVATEEPLFLRAYVLSCRDGSLSFSPFTGKFAHMEFTIKS
ncbi:4'-phosphopantetheinyl transferase superfamily protein [uncultured Pseudoteredinibacter sp.]|uniref:4'-phosphopantetheinyl transferase family protein n=1 Tax=uncultured Pseudoteredinibacter sp. TaxID=1641701 RepID=UPI00261E97C7|nr:4'-phosphopantetheinyl transferase superfamily protein [uncultured Pseudoteredinibacter sp.]